VFSIVLLLLVGGVTWIANYDPLVAGNFPAFAPADPALRMKDVEAFGVSRRILSVEVQRGDRFSYRFSIRNNGPVGITVTRIGSSRFDQQGNVVTRYPVRVIPDVWIRDGRGTLPAFEPWHAFSLRPGQEAIVEMEATYERGCIERGGTLGWYVEPVAFSVYGLPRETNFVTGAEVRFLGTEGCG
jgi:hypothetical protein